MIIAKLIDFTVEPYQWKVFLNAVYEKKLKKNKFKNIKTNVQFFISNLLKIFLK